MDRRRHYSADHIPLRRLPMWFRSWFGSSSRQATRCPKRVADRRRKFRRLFLESLEDRLTPSFTFGGVELLSGYPLPDGTVEYSPYEQAPADFNADGVGDYFEVDSGLENAGTGYVYLGRTDGTFEVPQELI